MDIEIQVVFSRDIATGEKFSIVRMIHSATTSDPRQWSLDIKGDEINEVIASMRYICGNIFPVSPTKNTTYTYRNNANLEIGCYTGIANDGSLYDWRGYINNTDYLKGGQDNYTQAHFNSILSVLQQAKSKL